MLPGCYQIGNTESFQSYADPGDALAHARRSGHALVLRRQETSQIDDCLPVGGRVEQNVQLARSSYQPSSGITAYRFLSQSVDQLGEGSRCQLGRGLRVLRGFDLLQAAADPVHDVAAPPQTVGFPFQLLLLGRKVLVDSRVDSLPRFEEQAAVVGI